MDDLLKEDMDKITHHYLNEVGAEAIILCGSRHVGDYKENSDWDFKLLMKDPDYSSFPEFKYEDEYDLDATYHDRSQRLIPI